MKKHFGRRSERIPIKIIIDDRGTWGQKVIESALPEDFLKDSIRLGPEGSALIFRDQINLMKVRPPGASSAKNQHINKEVVRYDQSEIFSFSFRMKAL